MTMKRTRAYWQKRAAQRFVRSEKLSLKHRRKINRLYNEAKRQLVTEMQRIYATYYRKQGWDTQALNSIAPKGDVQRFLKQMKKYGLDTELPSNYAARATRLDLLNAQIEIAQQQLALNEAKVDKEALTEIFNENYYRTAYDISKGVGGRPVAFSTLDAQTLDQVFSTNWASGNYAAHVYNNARNRAHVIQRVLATGIATGASVEKMSRQLREEMDVSKRAADRLIRTETTYFHGQAELETYREMEIEQYQIVAVLDNRTSAICQYMDKKVFDVKKAEVGVNMVPFHVNCRSTIVPYLGKEYEPPERIARDPRTGKNTYISNMSYDEWREKLRLENVDTSFDVNKALKKGYKTEYDEYKAVIGDQMINYERFVSIRKNGSDATDLQKAWWKDAKAYKRLVDSGTKPDKLDFYTFRKNMSDPPYNEMWKAIDFEVRSRTNRRLGGLVSLRDDHWLEHAIYEEPMLAIDASTADAYVRKAVGLLNSRHDDRNIESFIAVRSGDLYVYNHSTNEFASAQRNGIIKTYFKPSRGMDYWENQKERYGL